MRARHEVHTDRAAANSEDVPLQSNRHTRALERDVLGNQDDGGGIWWLVGQADVREPELVSERLRNLLDCREIQPDENCPDPLTGLLVFCQR
jgi:hypothetical protein